MAQTQQVRTGRKVGATNARAKVVKQAPEVSPAKPKGPKPAEEIRPISKSERWKLLYAAGQPKNPGHRTVRHKGSPAGSRSEEEDLGRLRGLCKNCRRRESCELPRPEGGVWRCEHYE